MDSKHVVGILWFGTEEHSNKLLHTH